MANANAPFGLQPVHADGRPWEGALNVYYVPSGDGTALYIGDVVKLTTSAESDGTPHVTQAAAGDTPIGVFMGIAKPLNAHGTIYRPASEGAYVLVADDPDQYFLAQEESGGGALAVGSVSLNIDISVGAGSAVTGRSGMVLDSSTVTDSATPAFRLTRLAPLVGNAAGDHAKWIVKCNLHARAHGTFGV